MRESITRVRLFREQSAPDLVSRVNNFTSVPQTSVSKGGKKTRGAYKAVKWPE